MHLDANIVADRLRSRFEASLHEQVRRYSLVQVCQIIPNDFFAAASSECRDMFVTGAFYGCITLCQSVAEGLAKFIADKSSLEVVDEYRSQINILQKDRLNPAISDAAYAAFRKIHGRPKEDRNDFHHLNPNVEQDYSSLETRAAECVNALYLIESEVFAHEWLNGEICPGNPAFWPMNESNEAYVFARFL